MSQKQIRPLQQQVTTMSGCSGRRYIFETGRLMVVGSRFRIPSIFPEVEFQILISTSNTVSPFSFRFSHDDEITCESSIDQMQLLSLTRDLLRWKSG